LKVETIEYAPGITVALEFYGDVQLLILAMTDVASM